MCPPGSPKVVRIFRYSESCGTPSAVLGGLADVERDLIRTRTAEGRSRAKARGQPMGRPPSLTPAQKEEATRRRAQGATLQELADSYDRSISTMRRATRAAQFRRVKGQSVLHNLP